MALISDVEPGKLIKASDINAIKDSVYEWTNDVDANGFDLTNVGEVNAEQFTGSGSGLTDIPISALTAGDYSDVITEGTYAINVTGSAGSVAWNDVTDRPTALSDLTNDLDTVLGKSSLSTAGKIPKIDSEGTLAESSLTVSGDNLTVAGNLTVENLTPSSGTVTITKNGDTKMYVRPLPGGQAEYQLYNNGGVAEWSIYQPNHTTGGDNLNIARYVAGTYTNCVTIRANTFVGINTSDPQTSLSVTGAQGPEAGGGTDGIFSVTTGNGGNTTQRVRIGIVDDSYAWISAIKPGSTYLPLCLQPAGGTANVVIGGTTPESSNVALTVRGQMALKDGLNNGVIIHNNTLYIRMGADGEYVDNMLVGSGGVAIPVMPLAYPGAGTKILWADPSDGYRVKFAA